MDFKELLANAKARDGPAKLLDNLEFYTAGCRLTMDDHVFESELRNFLLATILGDRDLTVICVKM